MNQLHDLILLKGKYIKIKISSDFKTCLNPMFVKDCEKLSYRIDSGSYFDRSEIDLYLYHPQIKTTNNSWHLVLSDEMLYRKQIVIEQVFPTFIVL